MSALTKRQIRQLKAIHDNVKRAVTYLKQDAVVGIAHSVKDPTGGSYTLRNPGMLEHSTLTALHIEPMNKFGGSDIAGVYQALTLLEEWIKNPELKVIVINENEEDDNG